MPQANKIQKHNHILLNIFFVFSLNRNTREMFVESIIYTNIGISILMQEREVAKRCYLNTTAFEHLEENST